MERLYGKDIEELKAIALEAGLKAFAGKQLATWLYQKHIRSFDDMTNISKNARTYLQEHYELGIYDPIKVDASQDGTKKYLYQVVKDHYVEAAYIPDGERATLCLSSQVGCKMGCLFCMTARQGFQGHLDAGEILNQLHSLPEFDNITNLVYMGMGEPLDNWIQVKKSIDILTSDWGYAMSPRRITLSTIGVIPAMKQFLDDSKAHLAISIHSPFDDERRKLMPIQQVFPIKDVIKTLEDYDWRGQRRLSFEYIMFSGVNDSPDHAQELVKLLSRFKSRVNLIHFHPIPDSPLIGSSRDRMEKFQNILKDKGLMTTIRKSRGEDILAACGLLSTKEKVKKIEVDY
ncbi:23S rRNA (adenine(2503)-C(2))-methyltransferase RlmN [Spirochaeta cellobiosiphila]|uniref:23S rRNA (adenine(2503)-C(2))-methyltransferase RlmN n=1 Tax=Spirochaeta cellobiosiphila TaxID=504483 RepID=UPI000401EB22|nr:23S rRNA (adenine(2503)-C(2))-methyltransferase RlmN [Spirochaeta cellobiosiphila]